MRSEDHARKMSDYETTDGLLSDQAGTDPLDLPYTDNMSDGTGLLQYTRNYSRPIWENYDYPPMELPTDSQATLITLYSVCTVMSVVGNSIVIIVLLRGSRFKTDLSTFLLNLAVADLCMACFCMPFTFTKVMLGKWIFGSCMCPIVLFMQVTSIAVSIYTNMAIGIDR